MKSSSRAVLLAATLLAGATAQFNFSDDAGGESTAIAEVVQLEAGDAQSTGEMDQPTDACGVNGRRLALLYRVVYWSSTTSFYSCVFIVGLEAHVSNPWVMAGIKLSST